MMTTTDIKILIAGPVNSGKTTLVRSLSETDVLNTDEASSVEIGKPETTVALDFGSRQHESRRVFLFGAPGQERFKFMWSTLGEGLDGLILLVAADRPADFTMAARILAHIQEEQRVPYIIGLTRSDLAARPMRSAVANALRVSEAQVHPVNPCDPISSRALLDALVATVAQRI